MKRIIDIDEELAEKGHWYTDKEIWTVIKAAQNGTPIPDNATNGDVIKAIFPKAYVDESRYETPFIDVMYEGEVKSFSETWWNAPYQKGDK